MSNNTQINLYKKYRAIGIVVLFFAFFLNGCSSSQPVSYDFEKYPPGKEGVLYFDSDKDWYMASTWEGNRELDKYMEARDDVGLQKMILEGEVFGISKNTKLKILQWKDWVLEVRVLDGKNAGRSGWIVQEVFK